MDSYISLPRKELFELEEKTLAFHAEIYRIIDLYIEGSATDEQIDLKESLGDEVFGLPGDELEDIF